MFIEPDSSMPGHRLIRLYRALRRRFAYRHAIPKTDERFDVLRRVRKHVVSRAPSAMFAKHDDGGSAEAEDRFFLTAFKRGVERMNLGDPADR
jgi:hypothetical protein